MNLKTILLSTASAALPAMVLAAPPASPSPAAAETFHRVELKGGTGQPLPYTIEVPTGWEPRQVAGFPGLWIGPADAMPPNDKRLIWVRGSLVNLGEPEKIVANIKASDASDSTWSAPRVEVKEVGGVRGVLVQMNTGEGDKARSSLTLKLPLEKVSVDLVASDTREDFPKQMPLYEHILFSARPVAAPAAKK
ncbi:MAG TPA: hypothetical protein VF173_16230 [Thermoanaerobaculia bacterium]|nr:hypothetical protein [Thermoanaerobaculia bacterium]